MVFGKVVEGMPVVMRMNDVEIVGKDRSWSYPDISLVLHIYQDN